MDVEAAYGLKTGVVDANEALHVDWASRCDGLDLMRIVDPEPSRWPALELAGFGVHPAWVTWVAPVGASEDAFLARLSRKERWAVRAGLRFVTDHGLRMCVAAPLVADGFDRFLELYDRQIAGMRHGVPFARLERDEILDDGADYFAVLAYDEDTLIGGCICRKREDISTAVIRFATTVPESRRQQVVRAMYMRVFATARELGFRQVSLGSDPALYGHMAKPGLFSFKSRLGFTPVPSRLFGSIDEPDEATMVLRLDALTEPSLLLCYEPPSNGQITLDTRLRLDVLSNDPDADVAPYRAPFLASVTVRPPASRAYVGGAVAPRRVA
jgi:GNAT superfamily N-acetyltransferase